MTSTNNSVFDSVYNSVWNSVYNSVRYSVYNSVWYSVCDPVRNFRENGRTLEQKLKDYDFNK